MRELKEIISTPINSIFIILSIMISIISIDMVNQILYTSYCRYSSERIFNNHHISIELNEGEPIEKKQIENLDLEYITNPISINLPIPGGFKNVSVYGMNNYNDITQLNYLKTVNNNYFSMKNYISSENVAIIGSENLQLTYIKNDKNYIDIAGVSYEVIDYLVDGETTWNHSIIIPTKALNKSTFSNVTTLNFNKKNFKNEYLLKIQNNFKNAQIVNNTIPLSETFQKMRDYSFKDIKPLVIGIIVGLITCILACKFWIKEMIRKIAIKLICGATWKNIIIELFFKLSLMSIPAFIGAIGINYYMGNQINNKLFTITTNNIYVSLGSFIIILFLMLILSIFSISKLRKINIIDYLR